VPRFEIGPLVSWINLRAEESGFDAVDLHRGAGGRFTLNVRRSFGIEAEIVGYPNSPAPVIWRTAGNLKVTARKEQSARINLFGLAGIGFMKQTRFKEGIGFRESTSHGPLFNFGGGIEYVPDQRIAIRFGLTDSLFDPPEIPELTNQTRQKVDLNLSLMLRFNRSHMN
jgi:hypothetical protein